MEEPDPNAPAAVVPAVYDELRRLAHHYMRGERSGHTLQTTALVNEAYLRLAKVDGMEFRDRTHFFAIAATMMRRILVDHARATAADKVVAVSRWSGSTASRRREQTLTCSRWTTLSRLAELDPQQARIVELLSLPD